MARADPMTALLSPAVGGSMQQQMETRLAQMTLKSPGLKSGLPQSPVARSFSGSAAARASLADPPQSPGFLRPDAAAALGKDGDAAGVLAHERAKLQAQRNRISAPALATMGGVWGANGSGGALDGVAEKPPPSPTQELTVPSSTVRPKSTDFSGLLRSPRLGQDTSQEVALSPLTGSGGDSWASMVNTPAVPMFQNTSRHSSANLDTAAQKLGDWSSNGTGAVPKLGDAKQFRRVSKDESGLGVPGANGNGGNNGNLGLGQTTQRTPSAGSWRGGSGGSNAGGNGLGNGANWSGAGARSPALSGVSSTRMGGSDDGSMAGLNMGMMPGMMQGMVPGMNPFMLANMGITPEAQLLAMQMAAAGGFGAQPGMSPFGNLAALQAQQLAAARSGMLGMGGGLGMGPQRTGRAPAGGMRGASGPPAPKKDEEDVDPRVLEDVPAWLRTLRLHKYTPNFEHMNWRDMVAMDEAALEANGVAALGARRKLLKTFEVVRKKMGIPEPGA
jgi:hypothetical protein